MAEGEHGGSRSTSTFVLIANLSSWSGLVRVTLYPEAGAPLQRTLTVPANSRVNIPVDAGPADGGFGPGLPAMRFATLVESLAPSDGVSPVQIVVERAMYSDAGTVTWAAGTNALGTRLP